MSRRFPALWLYTKALGALLGLCLVSLWYHAGLWRGVMVQGARNPALDGYYYYDDAGQSTQPMYVQNARRLGPRLPDVFGLSALTPATAGEDAKQYLLQQDARGRWGLGLRGALTSHDVSTDPSPPGTEAPPQTGWVAVRTRASGAPPIIRAVWRAEPAPREWRGRRGGGGGEEGGLAALAAMPGTAVLLAVNVAAALWLWVRRVPPEAVAVSYAAVVQDKQYWRCVTASFSHFEPLHLGFNMMSLYNMGPLEQHMGTVRYLYLSAALVAATMATVLLLQRAAIARSAPDAAEAVRSTRAVGYSCVLFAFMTTEAVLQPEFCPLPFAEGLCFATHAPPPPLPAALRVNAGPFALLLVVQAVMPRAGFLGHLAGIFMGYPLAWGWLDWLQPPLLTALCAVAALHHYGALPRRIFNIRASLRQAHAGGGGADAKVLKSCRPLWAACAAQAALAALRAYAFMPPLAAAEALVCALSFAAACAVTAAAAAPTPPPASNGSAAAAGDNARSGGGGGGAATLSAEACALALLRALCAAAALLAACDALTLGAALGKFDYIAAMAAADDAAAAVQAPSAPERMGALFASAALPTGPAAAAAQMAVAAAAAAALHAAAAVAAAAAAWPLPAGRRALAAAGLAQLAAWRAPVEAFPGRGFRLMAPRGASSNGAAEIEV